MRCLRTAVFRRAIQVLSCQPAPIAARTLPILEFKSTNRCILWTTLVCIHYNPSSNDVICTAAYTDKRKFVPMFSNTADNSRFHRSQQGHLFRDAEYPPAQSTHPGAIRSHPATRPVRHVWHVPTEINKSNDQRQTILPSLLRFTENQNSFVIWQRFEHNAYCNTNTNSHHECNIVKLNTFLV